jgi:hypothetical protein
MAAGLEGTPSFCHSGQTLGLDERWEQIAGSGGGFLEPSPNPFRTPRKRHGNISQIMTRKVLAYANKRPILTGLFTMLLTIVFGMSIAFATGLVTPAQAFAQFAPDPVPEVPDVVVPVTPPEVVPVEAPAPEVPDVTPVTPDEPETEIGTVGDPCCTLPSSEPEEVTTPTTVPEETPVTPEEPETEVGTVGEPCCTLPTPEETPVPTPAPVTPVTPVTPIPVVIYGCMDKTATNYNPNATSQDGVTCTYPPSPPSSPTCTLSANPTSISSGGSSTLSWTTTNAISFSIDNNIGSVTTIASGTASVSPTVATTYTGTVVGAGGTAKCIATVSINGGGGGISPSCSLSVSPISVSLGNSATLSWSGSYIQSVFINNGIGTTTDVSGSQSISPGVGSYTYTGTFIATNGQTLTCTATLGVTSGGGGGGGGGCSGNCGGGGSSGGGGSIISTTVPTMTLSGNVQPLATLSLSQIPYTGLNLGPIGTVFYWLALVCFALALTYLILFGVVPFIVRRARQFSSNVSMVLNAPAQPIPASVRSAPIPVSLPSENIPKEASHEYSPYDGFKSFSHNGALSIEDIVKSLSGESVKRPAEKNVEPVYENVEPISTDPIATDAVAAKVDEVPVQVRGFTLALIEGDRAAVFAGLRQQIRGGGAPEQLMNAVICALDDVYRARIETSIACDADIARRSARLSTPLLEKIIASLTTAIDSSYSDKITGAKLALTRALAIIGA